MSAGVGQVRLKDALKQLNMRWDRLRETWNDDAMMALHKDAIEPLPHRVNAALSAMQRLAEVVSAVHRDCE